METCIHSTVSPIIVNVPFQDQSCIVDYVVHYATKTTGLRETDCGNTEPIRWHINIMLPRRRSVGQRQESPYHDEIMINPTSSGRIIIQEILKRAAYSLGLSETSRLCALFRKRRIDQELDQSIQDLGFYNHCTVHVAMNYEWRLYVELPVRPSNHGPNRYSLLLVNGSDSCLDVNKRVISMAARRLDCRPDSIYALMNGTPLHRPQTPRVNVRMLGMRDGSTVQVHFRLHGGVCIARQASGRKRSVSFP